MPILSALNITGNKLWKKNLNNYTSILTYYDFFSWQFPLPTSNSHAGTNITKVFKSISNKTDKAELYLGSIPPQNLIIILGFFFFWFLLPLNNFLKST